MKDELMLEIALIKSALTLLSQHFDCTRYKDPIEDYWSITRYFHEYNDLLYIIQKKIIRIEELLKNEED